MCTYNTFLGALKCLGIQLGIGIGIIGAIMIGVILVGLFGSRK